MPIEQQRPDEVGKGAGKPDDAARRVVEGARRRHIGGGENGERQRHDDPAERAKDRDVDGVECRPPYLVDLAEIGRRRRL
jgi:hypothetical protein